MYVMQLSQNLLVAPENSSRYLSWITRYLRGTSQNSGSACFISLSMYIMRKRKPQDALLYTKINPCPIIWLACQNKITLLFIFGATCYAHKLYEISSDYIHQGWIHQQHQHHPFYQQSHLLGYVYYLANNLAFLKISSTWKWKQNSK